MYPCYQADLLELMPALKSKLVKNSSTSFSVELTRKEKEELQLLIISKELSTVVMRTMERTKTGNYIVLVSTD